MSQIFGNEHSGSVGGLGFGIVPSQMGVYSANSRKVVALQNQVTHLTARVDELTNIIMTVSIYLISYC